jgi:hypothetical protein
VARAIAKVTPERALVRDVAHRGDDPSDGGVAVQIPSMDEECELAVRAGDGRLNIGCRFGHSGPSGTDGLDGLDWMRDFVETLAGTLRPKKARADGVGYSILTVTGSIPVSPTTFPQVSGPFSRSSPGSQGLSLTVC